MSSFDARRIETGNFYKMRYRKDLEALQARHTLTLYQAGLRQKEIAEILQMSPTKVRKLTPRKLGGLGPDVEPGADA